MKAVQRLAKLAGRLLICGMLLGWIFHAIFCNEGRLALDFGVLPREPGVDRDE